MLLLGACGSPDKTAQAYLDKAQKLFDEGDYVMAKIEAMNAAQVEPKNVDVHLLLSKIERQNENYPAMIGHLQVAVDEDPWVLSTRLELGTWYALAQMADQAAENAEVAMVLGPEDARTHLLNARVFVLQGKLGEAEKGVDTALGLDPLLQEATQLKVGIFYDKGDIDGAMALLDEAIEAIGPENAMNLRQMRVGLMGIGNATVAEIESELKALIEDFPENPAYPLALAEFYSNQNMVGQTEETLKSIIDKDPTDTFSRIRFVRFLASMRSTDRAIEALKEFIAESPDDLTLRLTLGRTYENIGSDDDALDVYRQIAIDFPAQQDSMVARNRIVSIKIRQGEIDEARKLIREILADKEDNSEALLARAAFSFSERAYEDTIADLRIVLRSEEKSQRALLLLARAHVANGDMDLAQDAYRSLIGVNPAHSTASTELARLLARRGDSRLAEDVLRQRLKIDPNDRNAATGLIQALLAQGDVEAAEAAARNMLELEDESGLAEFQLGRVLQAKESSLEAIAAYKLALEKNPGARQPLENLIRVLVNSGQTDEAIAYLKGHMAKYPEQRVPRFLLGAISAREGDSESAEKYFEEIIAEEPRSIRPYRALAGLYADDPDKRISIYHRGLDANPANPTISLLLANEYQQTGRYDDAIEIYEDVLEEHPNNAATRNNLATLLLDHRSDPATHARALDLVKPFRESERPAFADTLGWAYYRNGDFLTAIPYLEIAVDGADSVPQVHFHLGMAYFKAKNFDSAQLELEKAIRLAGSDFPDIHEARQTLDSIQEKTAAR